MKPLMRCTHSVIRGSSVCNSMADTASDSQSFAVCADTTVEQQTHSSESGRSASSTGSNSRTGVTQPTVIAAQSVTWPVYGYFDYDTGLTSV